MSLVPSNPLKELHLLTYFKPELQTVTMPDGALSEPNQVLSRWRVKYLFPQETSFTATLCCLGGLGTAHARRVGGDVLGCNFLMEAVPTNSNDPFNDTLEQDVNIGFSNLTSWQFDQDNFGSFGIFFLNPLTELDANNEFDIVASQYSSTGNPIFEIRNLALQLAIIFPKNVVTVRKIF